MAQWKKTAKWKRARAAAIAERDGPLCWLCNRPIPSAPKRQGRRASIEHLEPRCRKGGDALGNLVLCHDSCNRHLGDRPVAEKWKMRVKWHAEEAHRRQRRPAASRPKRG